MNLETYCNVGLKCVCCCVVRNQDPHSQLAYKRHNLGMLTNPGNDYYQPKLCHLSCVLFSRSHLKWHIFWGMKHFDGSMHRQTDSCLSVSVAHCFVWSWFLYMRTYNIAVLSSALMLLVRQASGLNVILRFFSRTVHLSTNVKCDKMFLCVCGQTWLFVRHTNRISGRLLSVLSLNMPAQMLTSLQQFQSVRTILTPRLWLLNQNLFHSAMLLVIGLAAHLLLYRGRSAKYCDQSACQSLCLSTGLSWKLHGWSSLNFLCITIHVLCLGLSCSAGIAMKFHFVDSIMFYHSFKTDMHII